MEKYLYEDLHKLEEIHWWHVSKTQKVASFIKKLREDKKERLKILDVGCGTGKNLQIFSKFGETYGIDISPEAISYCKKRGLKNVRLGNSDKTGFPSNFFDVITLLDVLEHVDESSTLREIHRILKPEGKIIITVPAYKWLWSKWDEVLHHKRRYTINRLRKTLEEEGFSASKTSYTYSFLVLPVFLVRYVKSLISKDFYNSDFEISNKLINFILLKLAQFEGILMKVIPLPFGTSIISVAKKNGE